MMTKAIFRCVIAAGVFCGMFAWGCEQQAKKTGSEVNKAAPVVAESSDMVKIALRPTIGDMASYKVVTQARRTTKWQGPVPDKTTFEDNFNEERVEMVFTQRIQSVDHNGAAVARITID